MAWPELPRYRCNLPGCRTRRRWQRVRHALGPSDLQAARRAWEAHQAVDHPEVTVSDGPPASPTISSEEVNRAAELLVA